MVELSAQEDDASRILFLWENLLLASTLSAPHIVEGDAIGDAASLVLSGISLESFLCTDEKAARQCLNADKDKIRDLPLANAHYENSVEAFRTLRQAEERLTEFYARPTSSNLSDVVFIVDNLLGSFLSLGRFARQTDTHVSSISASVDTEQLAKLYAALEAYDQILNTRKSAETEDCEEQQKSVVGSFGLLRTAEYNRVQRYVMKVIGSLAEKCQNVSPFLLSPLQLRFFVIYLRCPYFSNLLEFSSLLEVCRCATKLSAIGKQILQSWFVYCPLSHLDLHTQSVREMMTVCVCEHIETSSFGSAADLEVVAAPYIRHGLSLLQILYNANKERRRLEAHIELEADFYIGKEIGIDLHSSTLRPVRSNSLENTEFYNDGVNQKIEIIYEDFKEWHRHSDHYTFGVLEHPFVLDPNGKARLLAIDSNMRQNIEASRSLPFRFRPSHLFLQVRRDHLVEDALNQLTRAQGGGGRKFSSSRLKNPLRVKFQGEEGVDQGGVAKEFFQLLIQQLFNVEYGMLNYHEESHYFTFKADSLEGLVEFELIGMILGLALYNQIILDVNFPPVMYKKLLSGNDSVANPGRESHPWNAFHMTPPVFMSPSVVDNRMKKDGQETGNNGTNGDVPFRSEASGNGISEGNEAANSTPFGPSSSNMMDDRIAYMTAVVLGSQPEIAPWRFPPGMDFTEYEMVQQMAYTLPPYVPCLQDLEDYEAQLTANLRKLLQMPPECVEDLGLMWCISIERFGDIHEVPLYPSNINSTMHDQPIGGSECPVTAVNREEYVQAVLKYKLVDCVKLQFDAFYRGFHRCCGGPILELLDAAELNLVICGSPGDLNFVDMEKGARYDGFKPDSQIVRLFWDLAHSLSQEDKKKLLFFITGSDRTPVGGLASIKLVIARGGGDKTRLPTARTCFNYLLLPEYESREELERGLRVALDHREGFYLQ